MIPGSPYMRPHELVDEFERAADAELWAEQRAEWKRNVVARAQRLRGEAQRQAAGAVETWPPTPAERRDLLDQKRALFNHLNAKRPTDRSAADDAALDRLRQELYRLERRCQVREKVKSDDFAQPPAPAAQEGAPA
jgi:hypothetical protein